MGTESDSPTFTLAAVALYDDVFKPTTETEKPMDYIGRRSCSTHESNGAFWYFCPKVHPMHTGTSYPPYCRSGSSYERCGSGMAMGFAPSRYIDLRSCGYRHSASSPFNYAYRNRWEVCADKNVSSFAHRLSWHLDNSFGGWRAGFYHGRCLGSYYSNRCSSRSQGIYGQGCSLWVCGDVSGSDGGVGPVTWSEWRQGGYYLQCGSGVYSPFCSESAFQPAPIIPAFTR